MELKTEARGKAWDTFDATLNEGVNQAREMEAQLKDISNIRGDVRKGMENILGTITRLQVNRHLL